MNYYETLYIVHPALEAGRLKDIIMGVEEILKKIGGKPLALELWGKRKLSHYIDKQKYGTYVLIQYNGEGKCTRDFAVELEHNPNILSYLTTLIDKNDVFEQEEDLDTQIAGKTREAEKTESSKLKTEISSSKNEIKNKVSDDPDESKQENSQDLKTNDNKESSKEEQFDVSSENRDDEQKIVIAEKETKEQEREPKVGEKSPEKEDELKEENADKTTAVSEEE